MAAASLVSTALGIIIILITAYVLAGSTLALTETVTTAQKDMTELQAKILGTSFRIEDPPSNLTSPLTISLYNTGNEPIADFENMDVYLLFAGKGPVLYKYRLTSDEGWWDYVPPIGSVYPSQWDPGEKMTISITYFESSLPEEIKVTTPNGISARRCFS